MKKTLTSFLIIAALVIPTVSFAQSAELVPCSGADCSFDDLITLFDNLFNYIISLGIIFSSLAFAYAGFLYITAQGDPGKVSKATKIFTNFAIGLILLLSAFLIIQIIYETLGLKDTFLRGYFG